MGDSVGDFKDVSDGNKVLEDNCSLNTTTAVMQYYGGDYVDAEAVVQSVHKTNNGMGCVRVLMLQ